MWSLKRDFFRPFTEAVFAGFFERRLEIDVAEQIAAVIEALGQSGADYLAWREGEGAERLAACVEEGHADHIFGVPIFLLDGEAFWGNDRLPLLEERLCDLGLARGG